MIASGVETNNSASAWLTSQSPDSMWRSIGQQAEQAIAKQINNSWAQSADEAWVNMGKAPIAPAQLPPPVEYPKTLNPFALVKAGDDAWEHLSDDHPWSDARVHPVKLDAQGKPELSAGDAAWRLIKAGVLEHGFLFIPPASQIQDKILSAGEKLAHKIGIKGDLEIPSPEFIAKEVTRIKQLYLDIKPEFVFSKTPTGRSDADAKIVAEAREFVRTLQDGHLDHAYSITDEEIALASRLINLKSLGRTESEIKSNFELAILAAAGDIAQQSHNNTLFEQHDRMGQALDKLSSEKEPLKMFVVDYVTSELLLTDAEQTKFKNRTWGLTPTSIVFRNISNTNDNVPLPLSLLVTNKTELKDGILMVSGTPDATDVLRKKGGRLLQGIGFRYGQQFGGTIQFVSLERDKIVGEIVVGNPLKTIGLLSSLANTIRKTQAIMTESEKAVTKQEAGLKAKFIRPNIVLAEMARIEAPTRLVSAIQTAQETLKALGDIFNLEKQAGRAGLNAKGFIVFQDPRMQKITEKLATRLAKAKEDEARSRKYLANVKVLPSPQ